jgi:hypothetical protein
MQVGICPKCGSNQCNGFTFFKDEHLCDSCCKDEKARLLIKHRINTSKSQKLYLIYHEIDHYQEGTFGNLVAIFHNLENAFDYIMIKTGNYNLDPAKHEKIQGLTFHCLEPYVYTDYMVREVDQWYKIVVTQSNDISEDSQLIRNILGCKQ